MKIDYPLNLKNKQIKPISENQKDLKSGSSIINIDNLDVVEIFGVNNENLNFFEDQLPIKVFQKGNQLNIKGEKKYRNILRNAILKTQQDLKSNRKGNNINLMQENLKMQSLNENDKIRNLTVTMVTVKFLILSFSFKDCIFRFSCIKLILFPFLLDFKSCCVFKIAFRKIFLYFFSPLILS